ncbi:MAG: Pr6Pr family membrane protein [Clostridia bacterium]|nr:Pr6Pr family membrane protein [Clostridia bacterium]
MRISNKHLSAGFKALIAVCAWAGILIQCGVFSGDMDFSMLRYYTLVSNVLIACYFSVACVRAIKGGATLLPDLKGALIMGITVTGLVFHTMLSHISFNMGSTQTVANQLLHTVTPLLCVADWLLFDEKGRYTKLSPLKWVIIPDIYFVFATIYGFTSGATFYDGSRFPYFFIDYDRLGAGKVMLYVVGLNLAFVALGYVFVLIDHMFNKKTRRKR